ncbi:MAG: hypothetical protein ABSF28_18980 [Terracidiphilus sp.]|jgi:hypothetical protein
MSSEHEELAPSIETEDEAHESNTLRVIGWFSIGMVVAALSIYLGYEVRSRYKFGKRTPYDFYANAGEHTASEFGMGI